MPETVPFSNRSTSWEAGQSILESPGDIRKKAKKAVLRHILQQGPHTCEQIETALGMKHQTVSARIRDLVRENYLIDSGEKRKTSSGRNAILWKERDT